MRGLMLRATTLCLSLLLLLCPSACALKCHFCGVDSSCPHPFDSSSSVVECEESCLKFDGRTHDDFRVQVRHCGLFNTQGCQDQQVYEQSATGTLCHCKTDLCNNSNRVHLNGNSILLLIFILILHI